MPHSLRPAHASAENPTPSSVEELAPRSLQELSSPLVGPDDVPVEIDDLASHFLLEATQSSLPPPMDTQASDPLFELDAPLEAALSELYFEDLHDKSAVRGFERMWEEILQREQLTNVNHWVDKARKLA